MRQVAAGIGVLSLIVGFHAHADLTMQSGTSIVFPDGSIGSATDVLTPDGHGGTNNTVTGSDAFVGGGNGNTASGFNAAVGGGFSNTAGGGFATVGGGNSNSASGPHATVGGGRNNDVQALYGTIAGGGPTNPANNPTATNNRVTDDYGTIGGGGYNRAGNATGTATDAAFATVAGGRSNTASGSRATVSGGSSNVATGYHATVGGGSNNTASGYHATVAGGTSGTASGSYATVGGGIGNSVSGFYSTVAGGFANQSSGSYATVAGGFQNIASGFQSAVAGGRGNTAGGDYSFAAGRRAKIDAAHDGTFIFADQTDADFVSLSANEFAVRASGGVRFITDTGGTTGVVLGAGGSTWSGVSSKAAKENYEDIDPEDILRKIADMNIQRWNYIANDDSIKHIGPYAEDFHDAFQLNGEFNGRITTQDLDGVALAAIQGLNQKLEAQLAERDATIAALQREMAALKERLDTAAGD